MPKYYITVLFREFTKTLKQFFTYLVETKIWEFAYLFDLRNRKNKSSFKILLLHYILINGHYLENLKHIL